MAATDTIRNTFGVMSSVVKQEFTAGVELEIEDIKDYCGVDNWSVTEDGSLRNNGKEFISAPLPFDKLIKGFKEVHSGLTHSKIPQPFSDRTSIHVHVNCLDLTQAQVKSFVLWYALFEPVFFAMVSPSRKNNIHCVALNQTVLPEAYGRTVPMYVKMWSKYTALNLLPLSPQGTVEFRHMEGHADADRFGAWLGTIKNLWTYAQKNELTKDVLSREDVVLSAFDEIFKDSYIKNIRGSVQSLVQDNLLDVKLAFV